MANKFGPDFIIQAPDPAVVAQFYVEQLGFVVTDEDPDMISICGENINMYIERGPALGVVFEVTVDNVEEAKARLLTKGCKIIKDEPDFPRCYVLDPHGVAYNLLEKPQAY